LHRLKSERYFGLPNSEKETNQIAKLFAGQHAATLAVGSAAGDAAKLRTAKYLGAARRIATRPHLGNQAGNFLRRYPFASFARPTGVVVTRPLTFSADYA